MRRLAVALGILCLTATAHARTATGYTNGTPTKIKIVDCGNSEAEVHTAIAFRAMAKAAAKAGLDLRIRSGFRSHAKQKQLYKEYQRGEGHLAARPGYSNHESGRALDIYITDYRVYEWLKQHAAEYGFHRTVPGEAWHWEYLGGYEPKPKAKRVARRSSKRNV
jgi:LAS superfamily LD-carboxypeptidase LdcB